jgi:hypothetical protein
MTVAQPTEGGSIHRIGVLLQKIWPAHYWRLTAITLERCFYIPHPSASSLWREIISFRPFAHWYRDARHRPQTRFDDRKEGWSRGGRSAFGKGRTAFSRNRVFATERRVVLKARVVGRAFHSAPGRPTSPTSSATASSGTVRRAAHRGPHRRQTASSV